MKRIYLAKLVALTVVGLIVTFVIDPLDKSTVSSPFMLGIILMGLSLRQTPAVVAPMCLVYSVLAVYAMIHFHNYIATNFYASPHPYFSLFQRSGLFLVLSGMSIYLSHYRITTQRMLVHIQEVLAKLPTPVAISDAMGQVLYVNESFTNVFKQTVANLTGRRYIDCFMSEIQEGKAMRYYIEVFEDYSNNVGKLEMKPFDHSTKVVAQLKCLGTGSDRILISVFEVVS